MIKTKFISLHHEFVRELNIVSMVSISNLALPPFQSFTLDNYNTISTRWEKYKKDFENLIITLNVEDKTQKKILLELW